MHKIIQKNATTTITESGSTACPMLPGKLSETGLRSAPANKCPQGAQVGSDQRAEDAAMLAGDGGNCRKSYTKCRKSYKKCRTSDKKCGTSYNKCRK